MRFPCLKVEGGLLAPDLLDQIAEGSAPGQQPADFGLAARSRLADEIAAVWMGARNHWHAFLHRLERLPESDPATTVTRDQWVIPLLSLLGYDLTYVPRAAEVDGRTFFISHRAGSNESAPPVHIVGSRQSLDRRPAAGRSRLAPHSLVQEYLNRTEHLWGIVTNGFTLRLLRDSQRIARQAYIEFDLQRMMAEENYADFVLFYRLAHRTRLPQDIAASDCWLESYYNITVVQGGRIRDHLRDNVEEALKILGNAILGHPQNGGLRDKVRAEALTSLEFYQQLLRLIYRFLFLMVAEERGLLTDNTVYRKYYSMERLRRLCQVRSAYTEHTDLWLGLKTIFHLLRDERLGAELGLPPLNGDLFNPTLTPDLNDVHLTNRDLLRGFWYLSMYQENAHAPWRRINYAALDVEELGSVYESLLDFHPLVLWPGEYPEFRLESGTERKTTGSYYTPRELVSELVESALVPVIRERVEKAKTTAQKEETLLSLKVCDPACGSGHFLLAAARRLGRELARIRAGGDEPAPDQVRLATREVIGRSIYGVDKNPLAVDLCKVALWIEGHAPGKPLTFLDHRIKCGDSLVGVLDLTVLNKGIPDEAFEAVAGDEKATARALKKRNREEKSQLTISFSPAKELDQLVDKYRLLIALPDDTPDQVRQKAEYYRELQQHGSAWWHRHTACNLWTAAFFASLTREAGQGNKVPTSDTLFRQLENRAPDPRAVGAAWGLAQKHRFFHWPLEFPEVFAQGGFDVVLCNPPWERIKLQEEEFFATRDQKIASALNKAARQRLINRLPEENPLLWQEYQDAKHTAEATSKFLRGSGRFPLTARGDINTYSVFTELFSQLLRPSGCAGVVLPTGIATDDTNKQFFAHLVETGRLVSLYDFENREGIFPGVHKSYKFSLLTMRGQKEKEEKATMRFAFFLINTDQLRDSHRVFELSPEELALFNPNTRTCPVFRTRADAELTKKIYRCVPVLINEHTGENPWGVRFMRMFDMSNDSHLFRTTQELERQGFSLVRGRDLGRPDGLCFTNGKEIWLPLYEAKMIWQFDHRFGTYRGVPLNTSSTHLPTPREEEYANPDYFVLPRYWVREEEVEACLKQWNREGTQLLWEWNRGWLLGFRDVTNATNERTAIFTILPRVGVGHTMPLILAESKRVACLIANVNTIIFDFSARQKIGGIHLTYNYLKQLPVLPPDAYTEADLFFIVPRVLELVYTAWDLESFAREVWQDCPRELRQEIARRWQECCGRSPKVHPDAEMIPPFRWDPDRRAIIRAELDAYYAKLYGLTRDELRYILDPKDVFGPDFPGETFRVLKEKEERQFGEYRTRRLVLEAWDRLENESRNWSDGDHL
ncbi:hypothetical protein Desku_2330 [Desulfofundulus kuznetsovii DSM 6115]|uniref:site-specific DNA-methyltransferase (adenine-specific) n=2 Tax=Desulfofundulus kuznetsovii TaxID=58135 RepID=A0AAU8PUR4_DESK7|nr:hypothetical protein Desku_2330 [Desulfofundulus kuznetsovii DSM 6115]